MTPLAPPDAALNRRSLVFRVKGFFVGEPTVNTCRTAHGFAIATAIGLIGSVASGGPNLMAIGQYTDVPFKRAEGRDSYSGKEIVYSFSEPEFDFGRIVVRSSQPNSVVRRDLFVGFTGEGLQIGLPSAGQSGRSVNTSELEVWLRIQGKLRPGRSYEWDIEIAADNDKNVIEGGLPAVMPVMWADGEPIGVEVTIRSPELEDQDTIRRLLIPHGVVTLPDFSRQTGGAWIVLKPQNFGNTFALRRFSFREAETRETIAAKSDMPVPVRYIPIRDVLEDKIAEALVRGSAALKRARNTEDHWESNNPEQSVVVTSSVVAALGGVDAEDELIPKALEWLAAQSPEEGKAWATTTVASRLSVLAQLGGIDKYRAVIHQDVQFLTNAQLEDGGWTTASPVFQPTAVTTGSDNLSTSAIMGSLIEAQFSGVEVESRLWRNVMQYWVDAQVNDGGFREKPERYGGSTLASNAGYTAIGAASLLASLDMAAGMGGRRCNTYLASRRHLRAVDSAVAWLDRNYKEDFGGITLLQAGADVYREPLGMRLIGAVLGLSHFNDHDHFAESARSILSHYDPATSMFGVRRGKDEWAEQPSLLRTTMALSMLGDGAAPTVVQRIISGDQKSGWTEYRGDVAHLVRDLMVKRGRPFNWRRTDIERDIRYLVKVPILFLSVMGRFEWTDEQWDKIRKYCLAGGTVVVNIAEGQDGMRKEIVAHLRRIFPEYELRPVPPDSPLLSVEKELRSPSSLESMSNGFREFLFLPEQSWSCQWHLYDRDERSDSFAFMNNLLTYVTDGSPLRSSFAPSPYAVASVPAHTMKAAHLQIGSDLPAYPDLLDTMDRLMQANFRVGVEPTDDPKAAQLLWVSVTGDASPSEDALAWIRSAMDAGGYVLIDNVSGNEAWDKAFRGHLQRIEGVTVERLRRTDPIYTGEIPGTQGFDAVQVNLRKALHTRFAKSGRCDLYKILKDGRSVGVYSAYDLSSGIGYHYFPKCRGVMPRDARELAMNAFLIAYYRAIGDGKNAN